MSAETIKDFLISLGFKVDDAGAKKFDATIAATTQQALKLGAVVKDTALSVVAFTAKIASGLDNLYGMSQRTGATVQGIQQIGYAVSQLGGTADGARSSLEGLAQFVRNSPGAEAFLNRLGVQTRDASGNMRDMASVFSGVVQKLNKMPFNRANHYAQMLGIDEKTLMAMRRDVGQFSTEYAQITKAIGYNPDVAAVSANRFMTSLRSFEQMADMARDKIGSSLAEGLSGSIDTLRKQIVDNFPQIEQTITLGIKGILWLGEVIGRVVYRLIQAAVDIQNWWNALDSSTQQLTAILGGLVVIWRVLNSAFMESPIGIIASLGMAIIGLYDDYRAWKEGGKSLINWGEWEPDIRLAVENIEGMASNIKELAREAAELFGIDPKAWSLKWEFSDVMHNLGELRKMLTLLGDLLNAINEQRWSDAASIGKQLLKQGSDRPDALPGVTQKAQSIRKDVISWYQSIHDKLNRMLPSWSGGSSESPAGQGKTGNTADAPGLDDRPVQYSNSFRQPHPNKEGRAMLGWLQPTFKMLEQLYRLPEGLLRSVAITESAGNPNAVSGAGAQGLFQIMPRTGRDLGLLGNDAFDPIKAAGATARYLNQLLKANEGDLAKALASYNWGLGNVQKHGMTLMPVETRNYVPRVISNMPPSTYSPISQETNIHIHGVNDPHRAANEVANKQLAVHSRFMQTIGTGPR